MTYYLARSRRTSGGTQSRHTVRHSPSAVWQGDCRARTARDVLVSRDRDAPAAAQKAAARLGPRPVRLERAIKERGRHVTCSFARSRRTKGGTQSCRTARPSPSAAGQGDHRARTARDVLTLCGFAAVGANSSASSLVAGPAALAGSEAREPADENGLRVESLISQGGHGVWRTGSPR